MDDTARRTGDGRPRPKRLESRIVLSEAVTNDFYWFMDEYTPGHPVRQVLKRLIYEGIKSYKRAVGRT